MDTNPFTPPKSDLVEIGKPHVVKRWALYLLSAIWTFFGGVMLVFIANLLIFETPDFASLIDQIRNPTNLHFLAISMGFFVGGILSANAKMLGPALLLTFALSTLIQVYLEGELYLYTSALSVYALLASSILAIVLLIHSMRRKH